MTSNKIRGQILEGKAHYKRPSLFTERNTGIGQDTNFSALLRVNHHKGMKAQLKRLPEIFMSFVQFV